ncbi:MAG: hypothetical protein HY287_02510 [Planctomycetes bacterium]|nr:hypothetical protein [Planctomycetota bacterium]MBI3833182.1 hypothetical protein [Planctomycetota bacterium]
MSIVISGSRVSSLSVAKPVGGFRTITTRQICTVWSAFRAKVLPKFLDVRVYFAVHEIAEWRAVAIRVARRKSVRVKPIRFERQTIVEEVQKLVGIESAARIRASLRRLERAGLLRITPLAIFFCESGEESSVQLDSSAEKMLAKLHERASVRERSVPIPRRTLRFLATNGRPALAATMLAQMIRCLWWNQGQCDGVGSCSSSFVADVFEVHPRNVKRARRKLREMGWINEVPAASWHVNAHGARTAMNLAWSGAKTTGRLLSPGGVISKSPPAFTPIVSKTPPPIDKHNLPSGSKNHKPACSERSGVRKRTESPGKPRLNRVVPDDLHSAVRLASLFEDAVGEGLVHESFTDRLRFFAAAEHAMRVGKRNPCGLFVAVVRRKLWRFISQGDEDSALIALKRSESSKMAVQALTRQTRGRFRDVTASGAGGGGDFVIQLVRELARVRSFEGVRPAGRIRLPCDEVRVAAA